MPARAFSAFRSASGSTCSNCSTKPTVTISHAATRIPAGGQRRFELPLALPAAAAGLLELRVRVRPGEHYERTFVQSLARADRLPPTALPLLKAALQQVRDAEYELLRLTQPLP